MLKRVDCDEFKDVGKNPETIVVREEIDGTAMLKLLNCKDVLQVTSLPKEIVKIVEYVKEANKREEPSQATKKRKTNNKMPVIKSMYDLIAHISKRNWDRATSTWSRMVEYKHPEKYADSETPNVGRYYSDAYSMQTLKREFRDALFCNCTTVDFENCHYRLLMGFYLKNIRDLENCPFDLHYISMYCNDRERIINELCAITGQQNDDPSVKELFSGALMGMTLNSWKRANRLDFATSNFPFYLHLSQEIASFRTYVADEFRFIEYYETNDDNGYDHSVKNFCLFLHTLESRVMVTAKSIMEEHGERVSCLIHDGMEVVGHDVADRLEDYNVELNQRMGYDTLRMRVKEKRPFDISSIEPCHDNSYAGVKRRFEQDNANFKVLDQNCYYCFDGKNFRPYNYKSFREKWLHMQYFDESKQEMVTFIDRWTRDENLLCYKRAELYPNRSECPPDCFNTFIGFDVEHTVLEPEDYEDETNLEHFHGIRNLTRRVVENDEHQVYLERYIAHLFQHPGTKPRVANIFQSNVEGIGKGSLGKILCDMIGSTHAVITNKPEEIFGTFNNLVYNKILVILDEKPFPKSDFDTLKSMVTEDRITIRSMFTNPFQTRCYLRLFNFLNQDKAIACMAVGERRFNITGSPASKMSEEEGKFYADVVKNKKALRMYYEYLMALPIDEDYAFDEHRPASILYAQLQEFHRAIEIEYLTEFFLNNAFQTLDGSRYAQCSNAEVKEFYRKISIRGSALFAGFVEFVNTNKFSYTSNAKTFRLRVETFFVNLESFDIRYGRSQHGGMDAQAWSFGNLPKIFEFLCEKKYIKPEQLEYMKSLESKHAVSRERLISTV